ncbi:hypothetical protein EJB05_37016, partial [Eragrostis curvula]
MESVHHQLARDQSFSVHWSLLQRRTQAIVLSSGRQQRAVCARRRPSFSQCFASGVPLIFSSMSRREWSEDDESE